MKKDKVKIKNKGGRPPKYSSAEDLVKKVTAYFEKCDEYTQPPEKAGLCLAVGIVKDTYNDYRKNPKFSVAIKSFDNYIESWWVRRLSTNAPTGAIFYLKNAFKEDFKDKHETDITSGGEKISQINYVVPATPHADNNPSNV